MASRATVLSGVGPGVVLRLGERFVEQFGGRGVEIGVPFDARDDEAARRLRLIVTRRAELFEIDEDGMGGGIGRLGAFDMGQRAEYRPGRRGEYRKNTGKAQDELVGDPHIGKTHRRGICRPGEGGTCRIAAGAVRTTAWLNAGKDRSI